MVGATLLLAGASSAAASDQRQRRAQAPPNRAALPVVSDAQRGERSPAVLSLLGRSAFSVTAQHDGTANHLPATRQNIELVGELEVNTPANLRFDPVTGDPDPNQPNVVPGQIADLAVHKGYAYLNSWNEPSCARGGTFIVDINNLSKPQQIGFLPALAGRYHGEGAHVVTLNTPAFQGDLLAVNNEPYSACAADFFREGGFDLYDVTNPRAPRTFVQGMGDTGGEGDLVGAAPSANSSHSTFVWQGNDRRAFIVFVDNTELHDVDIFEITDPANPKPVGEFDLGAMFDIEDSLALGSNPFLHDMVVKKIGDRFVMLADYWDAGYVTLDVTNPANPQYIGDTSFDGNDPLTGFNPPEGNAHEAEFSHNNQYILAADEDFNACRFDASITSGTFAGEPLVAAEGSDVPPLCPDNDLDDLTRYVGEACTAGGPVAAPAGVTIALVARGTCSFQEKYDNVVAAGYDAGIVFNSNSANSGCDALLSMLVEGDDIPFLFIPRTMGFQILGTYDEATYTCTPGGAATPIPPAPPVGGLASSVEFLALFDGWGYAHLYGNAAGKMQRVDSHAIEESLNPAYALGYGDLSIHEFATDPTENVAYSSYYAGGMRVFTFGPGGLTEQGKWIDDEGSNFWGVEQFTAADGQRYFAGSDRDFGLQIFRYTGPGAAQRPVCTDSVTMVPYKQSAPVTLACSDANNNPLTRTITAAPAAGTLGTVGPTVTYTHTGNRLGNVDQFRFAASDGAATSAAATARIVTVPRSGGRCFNPFVGTAARETLTGSPFGDRLRGGRGNDTLEGRAGADCLHGQGGRDTARGGDGNDRVWGGTGRDRLFGNEDADRLRGGPGNDRMSGGPGRDRLFGQAGNDRLAADAGRRHLLSGGNGRDRLFAANGQRDTIRCGRGRDTVRADRSDRVARNCESVNRTRRRR